MAARNSTGIPPSPPVFVLPNRVLTHPSFQRPPIASRPRRRGRLPAGVVSIKKVPALRMGALVELVGFIDLDGADNGKRARIIGFDPCDICPVQIKSLDGLLYCEDGSTTAELYVKPTNLRRLWTGLSERERIQLRFWRAS